ncbi:hypothetical protein [uncultured Sphaerochaeta sp.]|uniref:hypothetical protein n=1 Tax=uncultured Sphaerochaeta sp. TaxID=886478 RepID=UPI002A0A2028|nr:hypothetical protein [uncultured Sphaerochaeta sp.]
MNVFTGSIKFSNQQGPSFSELITIVLYAENVYVGINVGKLDQSCEVLCKKDQLLYLDTKDDSYSLIPSNPNMPVFELAVFSSGLSRNLGTHASMKPRVHPIISKPWLALNTACTRILGFAMFLLQYMNNGKIICLLSLPNGPCTIIQRWAEW